MSFPTEKFSQLSIGSTSGGMSASAATRSASVAASESEESGEHNYQPDDDSFDFDFDYNKENDTVTFPSGLVYSLAKLDRVTRDAILESGNVSSKLVLRHCGSRADDYIFEISELVEYTVRTGRGKSPYTTPSCSCRQVEGQTSQQLPCRHTLWLSDRITSQMIPHSDSPIVMGLDGYPRGMCDEVPNFKFDVLADSLQCDISVDGVPTLSPRRVQTAREILACLAETSVESYRSDLTPAPDRDSVIDAGDLEETVFRMLLDNNEFFSYFLASMRRYDLINNRFRRFRDRADAALAGYDEWCLLDTPQRNAFGMKDMEWCARKLVEIQDQIRLFVTYQRSALDIYDLSAAARTLIHILRQVAIRSGRVHRSQAPVAHRNLQGRLIRDNGSKFILNALDAIEGTAFRHLRDDLVDVKSIIEDNGAPPTYIIELDRLINRTRKPRDNQGTGPNARKRRVQAQEERPKRIR
ncbi:hypothetical protein F5Y15DRAFT_358483 [Xylariaceae sp. FL0016]|nr:hypothetical protein F5Y15DRAFT_358483 [Xylariaceae sp. FL0016]